MNGVQKGMRVVQALVRASFSGRTWMSQKRSHSTITPASAEFNETFKSTMSRICSQAMILTAGVRPHEHGGTSASNINSLHGMTLSSVCSLSVYPQPLLQFNLHLPSYTSQSLHENEGHLALHLLPPTSTAAMLSRVFASGVKRDLKHFDVKAPANRKNDDGSVFHEMTTPFANIAPKHYHMYKVQHGGYEIPVLNESERVFICRKRQVFEVDNHEIWVVDVSDILTPNHNYVSDGSKTGGLLYYKRGFHKVGKPLSE